MKVYLTYPREQLLYEMILYGPRDYSQAHPGWFHDLNVLRRNGFVIFRKGLWRVTKRGRAFYEERTGVKVDPYG